MNKKDNNYEDIEKLKKLIIQLSGRLLLLHIIFIYKGIAKIPTINDINITGLRNKEDIIESKNLLASIILRCESTLFLLNKMYEDVIKELTELENNTKENLIMVFSQKDHRFIKYIRMNTYYLELLINSIISLFDYLGNTTLFFLVGRHKKKGKWKTAKGVNLPDKFQIKKSICDINEKFVEVLSEIRADIFHYSFLSTHSNQTFNFIDEKLKFTVEPPPKLLDLILNINKDYINDSNSLLGVAIELLKFTFYNIDNYIEILYKDIIQINLERFNSQPSKGFNDSNIKNAWDLLSNTFNYYPYFDENFIDKNPINEIIKKIRGY